MIFNQWLQEKPDFDQECIVICESNFSGTPEYNLLQITKLENNNVLYWGVLTGHGEVWGDIYDLQADRYFIIQTKIEL